VTITQVMLAADFITKWRAADLTERAAAQSHFCDLCDLLGEQAPSDETAALPDISPAFAAGGLGGALFKGVPLAFRVGIGRTR
jgi:hypothetical protein